MDREKTTAAKIKKAVADRGLKQGFVAKAVAIEESRFSRILRGKTDIRIDEFFRIAAFLGVDPDEFLRDEMSAGSEKE